MIEIKLSKKRLGVEVIPFFEEELLLGKKCSFPNLKQGSFTLYYPTMMDQSKMYDFKSGGHALDFYQSIPKRQITVGNAVYSTQKVPSLEVNLYSCISSFFKQNKIKQCFINEILTEDGDGVVSITKLATHYDLVDVSGTRVLSSDNFLEFISKTYLNWHFLCIGLNSEITSTLPKWKEIVKAEVENINLIIILVYDGEGFIVWERSRNA